MDDTPETPEELEDVDERAQEVPADPPSPELDNAEAEPEQARRSWRKVVGLVGAGAALVGAAVVATLTATHQSAVRENGKAYFNGVRDGSDAQWSGLLVDDEFDDEVGPDCSHCEGTTIEYCPECHRVDSDA